MSDEGFGRVCIVGGSSGMGKATAAEVLRKGGSVVLCGRSKDKLDAARAELGPAFVEIQVLDATDAGAVEAYFAESGEFSHLVVTAGAGAGGGPFLTLPLEQVRRQFDVKFWLQYTVALYGAPRVREGGSILFFSGVLSRRPGKGLVPLATANAALEALTKALANDLGPRLRVNCLSPGLTRTNAFDRLPEERREAMFEGAAKTLPVGRVGEAGELGRAALSLLDNGYITGVVLDCDGGYAVKP